MAFHRLGPLNVKAFFLGHLLDKDHGLTESSPSESESMDLETQVRHRPLKKKKGGDEAIGTRQADRRVATLVRAWESGFLKHMHYL